MATERLTRKKNAKLPDGGDEKGNRRYPPDKHPAYDAAYDRALQDSPIINDGAKTLHNAWRSHNPHSGLAELNGIPEKDGMWKDGLAWKKALIPQSVEELAELHKRYQKWSTEQVRSGKRLNKPTTWPTELLELRLKKEAILDVRRKEVAKLRNQIKEQEAKQKKKSEAAIMPHGPITSGFGTRGSYDPEVTIIDGQRITRTDKGVPYIDEPDSKYHLLPLHFYFQIAKKWKEEVKKQGVERAEEIIARLEKECDEGTRNIPPTKLQKVKIRKHSWKDLKFTADDLPDWPKKAKSIDELETESA